MTTAQTPSAIVMSIFSPLNPQSFFFSSCSQDVAGITGCETLWCASCPELTCTGLVQLASISAAHRQKPLSELPIWRWRDAGRGLLSSHHTNALATHKPVATKDGPTHASLRCGGVMPRRRATTESNTCSLRHLLLWRTKASSYTTMWTKKSLNTGLRLSTIGHFIPIFIACIILCLSVVVVFFVNP